MRRSSFERFDVNIRGAFHDRFTNDLVDELHHRRFRIVGVQIHALFRILQRIERSARLQNFVERFRADAVERFHRAQNLRARNQDPFDRPLQ